jgi:CheY-like chemotaxis protein/anti-sigma regulatory factor (Ser/Thr protein kinase)
MNSIEQVLSIVSHDIKNPLNAIQLNIEMTQRLLQGPEDWAEKINFKKAQTFLTRAHKSTERIKKLIEDILDQASFEAGHFRILPKRACIESLMPELIEMFHPLAQQKSIHLTSISPSERCWADFDHERLHQALGNLVGNALKFTPAQGHVTLTLEVSETNFKFLVKDTGPGIPFKNQKLVFERFWAGDQTTVRGTGLGLFIAKRIIEAHGGSISLTSEEGKGSCFEAVIPRWKSEECFSGKNTKEPIKRDYILLVDDDEDIRKIIELTLKTENYNVFSVEDGEKGLEFLSQTPYLPSLIILDYSLPGINGREFVEKMMLNGFLSNQIPIMLVSAERNLEEKAQYLPIHAILQKPTTLLEILHKVKSVLH